MIQNKNRLFKFNFILLFFLSLINLGYGQIEENERLLEPIITPKDSTITNDIALLFKSSEDGVILRWAPTNADTWLKGNEYGYTIEKLHIGTDEALRRVGNNVFRPLPLANWQPLVSEDFPYRAAAAMVIHGEKKVESGFIKEAEDLNNRFSIALLSADLDKVAAEASGLRFLDQEVALGTMVLYRIYVNTPEGVEPTDTIYDIYNHEEIYELRGPYMVDPIPSDREIILRWGPKTNAGFSGYFIERSTDGINFERINERPYLDIITDLSSESEYVSYRDSIDRNDLMYYYRVVGIDAFADLSSPSNVVEVMGRDKIAPASPQNLEVVEESPGQFTLYWEQTGQIPADFLGYHVYKSLDAKGPYEQLTSEPLTAINLKYIDENPDNVATNYYYVTAVDQNGNASSSNIAFGFTQDEIPPAPPSKLVGQVDTNGMVFIHWDAPPDLDIRGYLVFYSNSLGTTFAVRSVDYLPNTHFIDSISLRTLTEEIYYYAVAVDLSYNQSERSEILTIKKPDNIPPIPAIFSNYKVSEEGINLEWILSSSDDVVSTQLLRRSANQDWEILNIDINQLSYLDRAVQEGQIYEYNLITTDDDGNVSEPSKKLRLEALKSFYIPGVKNLSVEKDKDSRILTWEYDNAENYEFIIYRSENGNQERTLVRLQGKTSYIDDATVRRTNYNYSVMVKGKDGRTSE